MKWIDLFRLSLQSLWRRKTRTILTMIGVMIGTASIVVMVSMGIGINQGYIDSLSETGELTRIELNSQTYYSYGGNNSLTVTIDGVETTVKAQKLDNLMIRKIEELEHVQAVTPVMNVWSFQIKTGKLVCDNGLSAVKSNAMEALDFTLSEGPGFSANPERDVLELIIGEGCMYNFRNPRSRVYDWKKPDNVDWLNDKFTVVYRDYNNADSDGNPKEYEFKAKVVGIIPDTGSQYSYSVFTNIDTLMSIINKNKTAFKNSDIKTDQYQNGYVRVDDFNNALAVQNEIKALGIGAWSYAEMIKSMQDQSKSIQLMLGGIGAVSMLVAAISIMNTMLMSIYERTREIGVMKVLGCKMGSIGAMFLTEAGLIGLGGGIVGLGLSFGIGYVLNIVLTASGALGGFRSVIPAYLAIGAVAFSVLVGVLSGLYPSQRAMHLSALAAIRNE